MFDWRRIFPIYWLQNYPTSREWDKEVRKALLTEGISQIYYDVAHVGKLRIWVNNWPYAYGADDNLGLSFNYLPSVKTRRLLREMVHEYNHRRSSHCPQGCPWERS